MIHTPPQMSINRTTLTPGSLPLHSVPNGQPVAMTPILQIDDDEAIPERTSTNRGWLAILVLYLFGAAVIAVYALANGRPARLYKGVNFQGLVCGSDHQVRDLPFLYFPLDPSVNRLLVHDARCVAACPTQEDVTSKAVIPTTKRVSRRHPELGSAMVFEFQIATPAYASKVLANAYCMPNDARLRAQLLPVLTVFWRQLSFAIGSLCSSWFTIGGYAIMAFLIAAIISLWLNRQLPIASVYMSHTALPVFLFFGGVYLMVASAVESGFENLNAIVFSANCTWSVVFGIIMVSLACLIGIFQLKSPNHRQRATRVMEMTGGVFSDMPNLITAPIISSAATFVFFFIWMAVFVHICSLGHVESRPVPLMGEGGISSMVSPLYRSLLFPSVGLIAAIYWISLLWWILEIIKSLQCFVVSYAGTVWYFAAPEGSDLKDMGWCPVLIALSIALGNHLGSLAVAGAAFGATALCRTFGTWAALRNDMCNDNSTVMVRQMAGGLTSRIRTVVDFLQLGGFTEMAISSSNFWAAMDISSRRLGLETSPASRLTASLTGVANSTAGAVSIAMTLLVYSTLSTSDLSSPYTSATSAYFVSSPILAALMAFILCWNVTSHFASMWSTLADALLYSYLVESSSPQGEVDENPADKIHAHHDLRELMVETLEDLSLFY